MTLNQVGGEEEDLDSASFKFIFTNSIRTEALLSTGRSAEGRTLGSTKGLRFRIESLGLKVQILLAQKRFYRETGVLKEGTLGSTKFTPCVCTAFYIQYVCICNQ